MELNKITQRLLKSLRDEGIEVFHCESAFQMPDSVRNCNALIYKHNEQWYCISIPQNQRLILSSGNSINEAMRHFDSIFKKRSENHPDYLEIERVYNFLKFEEVKQQLFKLVTRVPGVYAETVGAIANWGENYDGQDTLSVLEPAIYENFDDETEDQEEMTAMEDLWWQKSTFSSKEEEKVTSEVISTILATARYLLSYTESCYTQMTEAYNINLIEDIRNVTAQIGLLKVKLEAQLNNGEKL